VFSLSVGKYATKKPGVAYLSILTQMLAFPMDVFGDIAHALNGTAHYQDAVLPCDSKETIVMK
jgi:hypothetical protein